MADSWVFVVIMCRRKADKSGMCRSSAEFGRSNVEAYRGRISMKLKMVIMVIAFSDRICHIFLSMEGNAHRNTLRPITTPRKLVGLQ